MRKYFLIIGLVFFLFTEYVSAGETVRDANGFKIGEIDGNNPQAGYLFFFKQKMRK